MSRIGKKPITVPSGVDLAIDGQHVTVKGPKGSLDLTVSAPITVSKDEDGLVSVVRPDDTRSSRSLHGLTRTLISNMIEGVSQGFSKNLEIHGTGYRVMAKGSNLEFALGYSHPIVVEPPQGISFAVEGQNKVTVTGVDKQLVGQVAANIRNLRRPDPYKAKGVRYANEHIRRKVGKAGK